MKYSNKSPPIVILPEDKDRKARMNNNFLSLIFYHEKDNCKDLCRDPVADSAEFLQKGLKKS